PWCRSYSWCSPPTRGPAYVRTPAAILFRPYLTIFEFRPFIVNVHLSARPSVLGHGRGTMFFEKARHPLDETANLSGRFFRFSRNEASLKFAARSSFSPGSCHLYISLKSFAASSRSSFSRILYSSRAAALSPIRTYASPRS